MFKFVFDPGQEARKIVLAQMKALRDLRWLWPSVADAVEDHHASVFDREGATMESGGWMPLSKATARARFFGYEIPGSHTGAYSSGSTEGDEGRILHWTHTLRRSMTRSGVEGAIRKFQKTAMVFGTDLPYAEVHQEGAYQPLGPEGAQKWVPARPFLDPAGSVPAIARALHSGIVRMLNHDGKV